MKFVGSENKNIKDYLLREKNHACSQFSICYYKVQMSSKVHEDEAINLKSRQGSEVSVEKNCKVKFLLVVVFQFSSVALSGLNFRLRHRPRPRRANFQLRIRCPN